jgi:ribosomal protein S18 acetylase RimI-like enzyme
VCRHDPWDESLACKYPIAMGERLELALRTATSGDRPFLTAMAREACALEGRHPIPPVDDPAVIELLPDSDDAAVVAERAGESVGAAWWLTRRPALVTTKHGEPLPEIAMAVVKAHRERGIGTALVEALVDRASEKFTAVTLNVHLLNDSAIRLYMRTGFRVAGAGRGWYGVAMIRWLSPIDPDVPSGS